MNYPFLGYNTPGLQLGQTGGLGGLAQSQYSGADLNFGGNLGTMGANPDYTSVAGNINGLNYTQGNSSAFSGLGNWAAQNSDLLKSGMGLLTGGLGAWNGYNQNKLLEKQMGMQASQFREQMDLSKQNINRNLEDRQRARVASNPTAYESVETYMKKYGVK